MIARPCFAFLFVMTTTLLGVVRADEKSDPKPKETFKLIKSKTEEIGPKDAKLTVVLELYVCEDVKLDVEKLKQFCVKKKKDCKATGFLHVVVFDKEKNVKLPTTPITSNYGGDDDIEACKHIKAVYVYSPVNEFSELSSYEENKYDSVAKDEKIK